MRLCFIGWHKWGEWVKPIGQIPSSPYRTRHCQRKGCDKHYTNSLGLYVHMDDIKE